MEKQQIYDFYKSSDTTSTPYAKLRHQFDINSTPIRHHTQILRHQFDTNSTPIRHQFDSVRFIKWAVRFIKSAYDLSTRRTHCQIGVRSVNGQSRRRTPDQNVSTLIKIYRNLIIMYRHLIKIYCSEASDKKKKCARAM